MIPNGRIVILLLFVHQLSQSAGEDDILPWKNADRLIQAVCQNSNVCELNDMGPEINDLGPELNDLEPENACCEECTCQEYNNKTRKCFYSKRETETCMIPNTKHPNAPTNLQQKELIDAYLIVTKSPADGCVDAEVPPCNTDNIHALAPVSSRKTGKTYFNKECAVCHGEVIYHNWYRIMICDNFDESTKMNFETELQEFLENPATSQCFIQYSPSPFISATPCTIQPNLRLELFALNTTDTTLPEIYGMSFVDLADACTSNFYSPVFDTNDKKWYPNPFCYIYAIKLEKKPICKMNLTTIVNEYETHVNYKAMQGLTTPKAELPQRNEVCLLETYNHKQLCREEDCPLGHVFGKDSTCEFIGHTFSYQGYFRFSVHILIKRTVEVSFDGGRLVDIDIGVITDILRLPRSWSLIYVGHPTDSSENEQGRADWLLVGFSLSEFETSLRFMKANLDRSFQIDNGSKVQTYHQSIYPLSLDLTGIQGEGRANEIRCPIRRDGAQYTPTAPENILSTCWEIFTYNPAKMDSMVVSKLYYCNLVKLTPNEFELQANGSLLYNKLGKTHLYDKEFVVFENKDGEEVVKVCVEDSGLAPYSNVTSACVHYYGFCDVLKTVYAAFLVGIVVSFFLTVTFHRWNSKTSLLQL